MYIKAILKYRKYCYKINTDIKRNQNEKPKKLQKYKTSGYLVANSNSEAQPVTVISDDAEII